MYFELIRAFSETKEDLSDISTAERFSVKTTGHRK